MARIALTASTPVLFVDRIEPCLPFWERLGFTRGPAVEEGDHLGFVSLSNGRVEVMYQTFASLQKDLPSALEAARAGRTFLFVQVEDLDAIRAEVKDRPVYLAERTTFYGARELGVREPGGHYVTFAQFVKAP
jgi:hypothetical protein